MGHHVSDYEAQMTDNIPANPNSLENGPYDPTPEKGKGGHIRAVVSWLKGLVGATDDREIKKP